jgi:hypothetical protein
VMLRGSPERVTPGQSLGAKSLSVGFGMPVGYSWWARYNTRALKETSDEAVAVHP